MMVYQEKLVVSVKVGGRILRERDKENVYLPFGSEYSLLIKNLDTRRCVCTIEIDGKNIIDGLLGGSFIVGANQTAEIQRFVVNGNMSSGPRFKFIEKTDKISEHRGDRIEDGIIRVEYQFEEQAIVKKPITPEIHHHYHNYKGFDFNPTRDTYGSNTGDAPPATYNVQSSGHLRSRGITGQSVGASSNVVADSLSDDGITVHGQESSQQFHYAEVGALDPQKHAIVIKLHGTHEKEVVHAPLLVKTKLVCETCGTTNKSSMKCCGECGTSLRAW